MIAATPRGPQFFSRIDGGPPVLHVPGGTAQDAAEGAGDDAGGRPGGSAYGPDVSYGDGGAGYGIVNLAPRPLAAGTHTVEIDVKDVDGGGARWSPPLRSAFVLTGFVLDRGARAVPPPAAAPRRMLLLGDSITEGVRDAGPQLNPAGADATLDYSWLTGRAFGADFRQVGFGGQGIVNRGDGGVPPAPVTLRYNYRHSPAGAGPSPQVVVVNEGTNDHVSSARFEPAYLSYLRQIRAAWPGAWILAMRPFDGLHAADIGTAVRADHDPRTRYVDTRGWLRADEFTDGLHPSAAGHLNVARRLEPVIARVTGWRFSPTPAAACQLLPVRQAGTAVQVPGAATAAAPAGSRPMVQAAMTPRTATWAGRYGGEPILAAAPATGAGRGTAAGPGGWRKLRVDFGRPIPLPAAARDLFLYVSVPPWAARSYAVRLTISSGRASRTVAVPGIPVFPGFLPWARVHIGLGGWRGPLTGLTVEVRGDAVPQGSLPFVLTGLGWTNQPDG